MRLFLLPVSTRRTLIYCERLNVTTTETKTWLDKGTTKAANLWARWEKKGSGWQKKVVDYGNEALKRIPYEEWGLKSIPPLSARRKAEELSGKEKVEVSFPKSLIPEERVQEVLRLLGTERQGLHRKKMIWSFVGMPISAPFALVPIALSGSKHVEFLLENKLIKIAPSRILDELYVNGKRLFNASSVSTTAKPPVGEDGLEEQMVLHKADGKKIAAALDIPELDVELDRAVWQVEKALKAEQELKEETAELRKVNEEKVKK